MSIPIVNDYSDINRRMRQLKGDVALPHNIYILLPNEVFQDRWLREYDTIFQLHTDGRFSVFFARNRGIVVQRIGQLCEWLSGLFPSIRVTDREVRLSESDYAKLVAQLQGQRRDVL